MRFHTPFFCRLVDFARCLYPNLTDKQFKKVIYTERSFANQRLKLGIVLERDNDVTIPNGHNTRQEVYAAIHALQVEKEAAALASLPEDDVPDADALSPLRPASLCYELAMDS